MVDQPRRDDLAPIYAELAALRAQAARDRRRLPRRFLPVLLAALLVAVVPLATLAANPFTDLNPGSPHNGNIEAIYDAGIAKGCDPDRAYCPSAAVTREEMASFLARAAGLGDNPPVANALTARTATSATNAATARDASALGGQPPSAYQRADQPAANAANAAALGGQPPAYYQPAGQPVAKAGDADTVGGYAPSGLIRVGVSGGGAFSPGIPVTTANFTRLNSVRMILPARGLVLVTASATVKGGNGVVVEARLRDNEATNLYVSPTVSTLLPAGGTDSLTMTFVFIVYEPGERNFSFEGHIAAGSNFVYAGEGAITAIYSPFGSQGAFFLDRAAP